MTTPIKKDRQSSRRLLKLIWILQGHSLEGLRLKQIAEGLGTSMPNAYRDLELLADEGMAERIPGRDEYWRLTPKLIQLARAHEEELGSARRHIDELEQRYSRAPK